MNCKAYYWLLCLGLLFLFSGLTFAQNPDMTQVEALLTKIAVYDYGQSREPLTQWEELERSKIKIPGQQLVLEKKLNTILSGKAPLAAKQFVCQRLSIIGSSASLPALNKLLADEKTADMARYALERIPGSQVDAVLEKSLTKSSGLVKIGIVNTLGQRASVSSAPALAKLLGEPDPILVMAAAAALGKIADTVSLQALEKALPNMKADVLPVALDAYLKCADKLSQSKPVEALAIYAKLQSTQYPDPVRCAALRSQVLTDKANAAAILQQTLQKGDHALQSMAIMQIGALPATEKMQPFALLLTQLPAELKVQLLSALADRGDKAILEQATAAAQDNEPAVRIAALKALTSLGNASVLPVLVKAAANASDEEKKSGQEGLYLLNAPEVDDAIIKLAASAAGNEKVELITAIGERSISSATPLLLQMAQDREMKVRVACLKVLGQIAAADDMPALVDLLLKTQSETEQNEAVTAVAAVSQKISDPNKRVELALARLPQVKEENGKIGLLRILGRVGASSGLPVLRSALNDKSEELQIAAIRALSDWPNSEPIDDLLKLAQTGATPRHQVLALRGFIRLVKNDEERPEEQTVALYQQAMKLAKEDGEKKSVLSGLAELSTLPALTTAMSGMNDPTVQEEVGVAVLKLGRRLAQKNPQEVKKAVAAALSVVSNANLKNDLQSLQNRIK